MPDPKDDLDEYLARIRKTIAESEALVAQTELRMRETDRLLESQGLTREQVLSLRFAPAPVGVPAAPAFAVHDSQGDLENRQKKFGMMMKPFSL